MMLFEGMPWPLVIPLGIIALTYAVITSKKEEKAFQKELDKLNRDEE